MIRLGWEVRAVQRLSLPQVVAALKESERIQTERDCRHLMIAAAGAAGGKAYEQVLRFLKRELRQTDRPSEPESETPRSLEDLERMMQEDNG